MFFDSWTLDGYIWSNVGLLILAVVYYFIGEARHRKNNPS